MDTTIILRKRRITLSLLSVVLVIFLITHKPALGLETGGGGGAGGRSASFGGGKFGGAGANGNLTADTNNVLLLYTQQKNELITAESKINTKVAALNLNVVSNPAARDKLAQSIHELKEDAVSAIKKADVTINELKNIVVQVESANAALSKQNEQIAKNEYLCSIWLTGSVFLNVFLLLKSALDLLGAIRDNKLKKLIIREKEKGLNES